MLTLELKEKSIKRSKDVKLIKIIMIIVMMMMIIIKIIKVRPWALHEKKFATTTLCPYTQTAVKIVLEKK